MPPPYIELLNRLLSIRIKLLDSFLMFGIRRIELEFQQFTDSKAGIECYSQHLQNIKLDSKNFLLVIKYHDNVKIKDDNTIQEEYNADLSQFLSDYANQIIFFSTKSSIQKESSKISLINQGLKFSESQQEPMVNEISPEGDNFQDIDNPGTFITLCIQIPNEIKFQLIIEFFQLYSVMQGHYEYIIRNIPIEIINSYEYIQHNPTFSNIMDKIFSLKDFLPINKENEVDLYEFYEQCGYFNDDGDCNCEDANLYFESSNYFMNKQELKDKLLSFQSEFDVLELTTSIDSFKLDDEIDCDLSLILGLSSNVNQETQNEELIYEIVKSSSKSQNKSYFLVQNFINSFPIFSKENIDLGKSIISQYLIDIIESSMGMAIKKSSNLRLKTNVKQQSESVLQLYNLESKNDKLKSLESNHENFQIILFCDLSFENHQSGFGISDIIENWEFVKQKVQLNMEKIFSKRICQIIQQIESMGTYCSVKAKQLHTNTDYLIPQLSKSLANSISMIASQDEKSNAVNSSYLQEIDNGSIKDAIQQSICQEMLNKL